MRDELSVDPWLDPRPRPGSAEPELGLRSARRRPAPLSGTENAGRLSSPPNRVRSRLPSPSAALPVGSLLCLVLVGLVAAAIIGVFFGAGFLLLVHPEKEIVADTGTRDPWLRCRSSRATRRRTRHRRPPAVTRPRGPPRSPSRHQAPRAHQLLRCLWRARPHSPRQKYRLLTPQRAGRPATDEVITVKLHRDIGIHDLATAPRP